MTYQERVDRIGQLLEEQLGIRGKTLEHKLSKAGRLLPQSVHRDAGTLIDAAKKQGNPKLARMVDEFGVVAAYDACDNFLSEIDAWDRKKGMIIGFLSTNLLNLLIISGVVMAVLVWRGFI